MTDPAVSVPEAKVDSGFDLDNFMEHIAHRESHGNYSAVAKVKDGRRFLGKYQLGEKALRKIGYGEMIDEQGGFKKFTKNFLKDHDLQEEAGKKWFGHLIGEIQECYPGYIGQPLVYHKKHICPEIRLESLLAVAHLGGTEGLEKLMTNQGNPWDGHTHLTEYAVYGYLISIEGMNSDHAHMKARGMDRKKRYSYSWLKDTTQVHIEEPMEEIKRIEPKQIDQIPIPKIENEIIMQLRSVEMENANPAPEEHQSKHKVLKSVIKKLGAVFEKDKEQDKEEASNQLGAKRKLLVID